MAEKKAKIMVVDDEKAIRQLIIALLDEEGYAAYAASCGAEALRLIPEILPDLILLDVMMPGMTGYDVAERLKSDPGVRNIPIIIVTALGDRESRIRGLEAGAEEYLTKPIDRVDIRVRVRNLLRLKEFGDFLKRHNRTLEEQVRARTREVRDSFLESIFTLMRAAEFRDDETGAHVRRVSHYTKALAGALGMDGDFRDTIFHASPMHDIGKIGIPDGILLKPGGFTPRESEIMQTHTTIGGEILKGASSPYLRMGEQIALCHHERWNGGGYPCGFRGEAIPLPARIMQLADIYDALRSRRPYKPAFDHAKTMEIILRGDDHTDPSHFDPAVLAAFEPCSGIFAEIFEDARRP